MTRVLQLSTSFAVCSLIVVAIVAIQRHSSLTEILSNRSAYDLLLQRTVQQRNNLSQQLNLLQVSQIFKLYTSLLLVENICTLNVPDDQSGSLCGVTSYILKTTPMHCSLLTVSFIL